MATAGSSFQKTVFINQGFGVPGEVYSDVPWIVDSYVLRSAVDIANTIGSTAYTITEQGVAEAGNGGPLGFAGILCSPKSYALFGTSDGPLTPTLELPNETQAEIISEGRLVVTLPDAANIGDYVIYDDVTGILETMSPGDTLPSGKSFANAKVVLFNQTTEGSGLAVIQLADVIYPIPTVAP